jgi:2-methylcitrate dehydratase PrpD
MERITVKADPDLNAHTKNEFPAVVVIYTRDGHTLRQEMLQVPGSPNKPFSDEAVGEKLRRFGASALSPSRLQELQERLLQLDREPDMSKIGPLLRAE